MKLTALGIAILALMLGIPTLGLIWEHWPRTGRRLYEHRRRLLDADMRRRGLTVAEQQMEMRFRYAMVELGRRASEWTLQDPDNSRLWINIIAKEIADKMMPIDRETARRFLHVVHGASEKSILTPEAWRAALDAAKTPRWFPPRTISEDDIAAVSTKKG